ncbi:MAG: hypothetical protein OEZ39_18335 [Gammaproteobacteria bacterium]|nr:hypothetical protein [Gammaproteobacteria bacterium]MDH5653826.1 hypothetical protein [Gammaproteobacteria bacterium]
MFDEPQDKTDYRFHVELIEAVPASTEMPGDLWHRYVIGRGDSQIVGMRSGSMAEVRQHAEAVADDLNNRTTKTISTYASRNKKR